MNYTQCSPWGVHYNINININTTLHHFRSIEKDDKHNDVTN